MGRVPQHFLRIHKKIAWRFCLFEVCCCDLQFCNNFANFFFRRPFLKQLQLLGSFQCEPSMWRCRTTVTGLVCIAWIFVSFMNGYQLTFAKAWSQQPAESPAVLPWDRGCWKHVIAGKKLFSVQPAILRRPIPPPIVQNSSSGEQQHYDKLHRAQPSVATLWQQVVKSSCDDSWTEMRDSKFPDCT